MAGWLGGRGKEEIAAVEAWDFSRQILEGESWKRRAPVTGKMDQVSFLLVLQ